MISAEAYIMPLGDVVIKAKHSDSGERVVEVQASSEAVDSQGDVVLQRALLDSADSFVKSGHLDIDHYSEIGARIGIRDPESYIIGRPTEVTDLGGKKTGVVGQIMRSRGGDEDPANNRFDAFWKSLQSEPPVKWRASIYGFPTDLDDCAEKSCSNGATRFVIKQLDWRSLAFTRNPVNQSLGYAKVVTAKSMAAELQKDLILPYGLSPTEAQAPPPPFAMMPGNLDHMWGQYLRHKSECPHMKAGNSVSAFRDHYVGCCGSSLDAADIFAHALMYAILRDRKNSRG